MNEFESFKITTTSIPKGIDVLYESETKMFNKTIPYCDINNAEYFISYNYDKGIEDYMIVKVGRKEYKLV